MEVDRINLFLGSLNLAITGSMFGLIWVIQTVHYPSFAFIEESKFKESMQRHQKNIGFVVIPLMILELVVTMALIYLNVRALTIANGILLIIVWASTFYYQVPLHGHLLGGKDSHRIIRLVQTNWIRTIGWSLKLFVAFLVVSLV